MGYQYSPGLPVDRSGQAMQEYPAPKLAKVRYTDENASTSSVISVGHDTTALEVSAVGGAAVMRWVATTDTQASVVSAVANANYDHVISANTTRRFVIPIESVPYSPSVQGVNRANGLYQRVAIKSVGVASVMLSEY